MTKTIDRESVDQALAKPLTQIEQLILHVENDLSEPSLPDLLGEIEALRAALDKAEARLEEARALALQEAADLVAHDYVADAILALTDTTHVKALAARDKRVRAEAREVCAKVAFHSLFDSLVNLRGVQLSDVERICEVVVVAIRASTEGEG